MTINNKFEIGQIIYHKLNPADPGMVTGLIIRPRGHGYYVTWDDLEESHHYEMELTDEKGFEGQTSISNAVN